MKFKGNIWYKSISLLLLLVLLVPVLAACDDNDDDKTTTPAATTSEETTPVKTTSVKTGTVKIGVIMPFSGGMAMAGMLANDVITVVEKQVEARGGIQMGDIRRPMKIVTYDDKGEIAGTVAGYAKLVMGEGVSIMGFGGGSGAAMVTMAEQANEYKVPYVTYAGEPVDLTNYPYTSRIGYNELLTANPIIDLIDDLAPETVALLGDSEESDHNYFDYLKEVALEPAGIDIVYEQYIELGTQDMSLFLTAIRYENPDMLIHFTATFPTAMATFKQIMDQGGWGNINYVSARSPQNQYLNMPGAEGTYQWMFWSPKVDNPGTKELLAAWDKYGKAELTPLHVYFYNGLWTAIHAIELAGSGDPEDINNALRSGKLSWEAPVGLVTIGTDGENNYNGIIIKVSKHGDYTIVIE